MTGPLDGIKIVDLTSMISGPVATMLLADQGAEVIKVEPKNGDIVRHVGFGDKGLTGTFLTVNRGKKSINLDLKSERGKEVLKKIIITADCFIQNFRPGAIERIGFGEEEVRKIKEDIVYVSISGFGEDGPYSKKRVYDPVIQALSGLASIQSDRETGRPRMVRTIVPDKVTALTAAQAITAALLAKERKGIGQHVRLSMLDSMINFLWPEGLVHLTFNREEKFSPDKKLSQDLVYETKDNYITVGAVADSEWEGLCISLDKEEWISDERFDTPTKRVVNAPERFHETQKVLRNKTAEEWLEIFDFHDVPCAPVLDRSTLLQHEQIIVNEIIEEYNHPTSGIIRQARPAAKFSKTEAKIKSPAPLLGEHKKEILLDLGMSEKEISELL